MDRFELITKFKTIDRFMSELQEKIEGFGEVTNIEFGTISNGGPSAADIWFCFITITVVNKTEFNRLKLYEGDTCLKWLFSKAEYCRNVKKNFVFETIGNFNTGDVCPR